MKWILIIAGTFALLVVVAAVVGAMLPRGHHATRQARYRQTPEAIYAVLAGPPTWRSGVKAWAALPERDGHKQWWEQDSHGEKIVYELVEEQAPVRRVTRIADETLPYGGTWTVEITPVADGGAVRVTEDGEVRNAIFRFLSRFVFGHTATIEAFLRELGVRFGEQPAIEE
jgi:hypothetical protein